MKPVSDPTDDIVQRRNGLRRAALEARESVSAAQRQELELQLMLHLDGLVRELAPCSLGFCWPYRAEPDLRAWVQTWLARDERRIAALPVVVERDAAMHFRRWTPGAEMVLDRHGIPHPAAAPEVKPELVLVPLNAFDAAGYRLGYGGGYFDRTLAQMETLAVGVGFELGRVPTTLPQAHDLPMDWIVTEAGALRVARAGGDEDRHPCMRNLCDQAARNRR